MGLLPWTGGVQAATAHAAGYQAGATEPVMTPELMDRLIKRTLAATAKGTLDRSVSGLFALNDGTSNMPAKQLVKRYPGSSAGAENFRGLAFIVPVARPSDVVMLERGELVEVYLTDRTATLIDAGVVDARGARRITRDQAREKYQAVLKVFAKSASALPPAGPGPPRQDN